MSSGFLRNPNDRCRRVLGGNTLAARTYEETAAEWNRRSGQNITPTRVQQIVQRAMEKLAESAMKNAPGPAGPRGGEQE